MVTVARILAVAMIAAGSLSALPLGSASAVTVNVPVSGTIGQTWYCSSTYENSSCPTNIVVGDTVNWVFNGDIYSSHTTTHCGASCSTPTATPLWDSPVIQNGNYSYTFNTAGTYLYYCEVHGTQMLGAVTVAGGVGGETILTDIAAPELGADSSSNAARVLLGIGMVAAGALTLVAATWATRRFAERDVLS